MKDTILQGGVQTHATLKNRPHVKGIPDHANIKDGLATLHRFAFAPRPSHVLVDEHMNALNEYIQLRVEHLLSLPTVDAADLRRKLRRVANARTADPFAPER